jgi:hypothetical protein
MNYLEQEAYLNELYKKRDEIQLEIERIKKRSVLPSCYTCKFFHMGKCSLNGLTPPEKIFENGCECFKKDNDFIPF